MKRDLRRREAYALHRISEALTRLLQAQTGGEIVRANGWVKAWFDYYHTLSASARLLAPAKPVSPGIENEVC
ncbi:MAG: hypothetical protein ACOYNZ_08440 [Rhodoferax sp.]